MASNIKFTPSDLVRQCSGTRFMLDDSTPAIYVGPGGLRTAESVPLKAGDDQIGNVLQLKFHSVDSSHVIAYWYKTEWHLIELLDAVRDFDGLKGWSADWSDSAREAVLNRARSY